MEAACFRWPDLNGAVQASASLQNWRHFLTSLAASEPAGIFLAIAEDFRIGSFQSNWSCPGGCSSSANAYQPVKTGISSFLFSSREKVTLVEEQGARRYET
jgi:hypothetical protein